MAKKKSTKKKNTSKKKVAKKQATKKTPSVSSKKASENKGKKKQETNSNEKILRNLLIIAGVVLLVIIAPQLWESRPSEFEYRGVDFKVVEFCDAGPPCLMTYNTKIPVTQDGRPANYNFYLRNHPEDLDKKVPFDGELELRQSLDLNITYGRSCQGYSNIGIENLARLIGIAGISITEVENESDISEDENTMTLIIQEGDKTKVSQTGPASYTIDIKECEVLEGTERFMIEMLVYLKERL